MASSQPYIAATVPATILRVSSTTLFHLAMKEFGDALWWTSIADLNGLTDPWITGQAQIAIPPLGPQGSPTGILGL